MIALMTSQQPIIICANPAIDSPHTYGRRMFANLKIDRNGLPRPINTVATRIKRKKSQPQPVNMINLNSDDIVKVSPLQKKVPPPDIPSSNDTRPQAGPLAPPQKRQMRPKPEVVITKKNALKVSIQPDDDVLDISSASDSEYQPDASKAVADASGEEDIAVDSSEPELELLSLVSEGKGKGKKELSSRIQKKRVKGSGNASSKDKGKGKMQSGESGSKDHRRLYGASRRSEERRVGKECA